MHGCAIQQSMQSNLYNNPPKRQLRGIFLISYEASAELSCRLTTFR